MFCWKGKYFLFTDNIFIRPNGNIASLAEKLDFFKFKIFIVRFVEFLSDY